MNPDRGHAAAGRVKAQTFSDMLAVARLPAAAPPQSEQCEGQGKAPDQGIKCTHELIVFEIHQNDTTEYQQGANGKAQADRILHQDDTGSHAKQWRQE